MKICQPPQNYRGNYFRVTHANAKTFYGFSCCLSWQGRDIKPYTAQTSVCNMHRWNVWEIYKWANSGICHVKWTVDEKNNMNILCNSDQNSALVESGASHFAYFRFFIFIWIIQQHPGCVDALLSVFFIAYLRPKRRCGWHNAINKHWLSLMLSARRSIDHSLA